MALLPRALARIAFRGLWLMAALAPAPALAAPIDFELAGAQGFVRYSALPPQVTLINLWRFDCPPCLEELPLLQEIAQGGSLRVITIALQKPGDTLKTPESLQGALKPPLISLHGPSNPEGLLKRLGNPKGLLPFSVLVNEKGQVCGRRAGKVTSAWVEQTRSLCPP